MSLPHFPFWIDRKYEALELLGKGGGGFALLAKKGGKKVCVKLLNLGVIISPDQSFRKIETFKKEFLILKKIDHPHIGKLFDFGFDTALSQYYFVGEYIDGCDIKKGCENLSIKEIEKLFVQALQALHYLHTFGGDGVRHNDIKAANMLVTLKKGREPQLKLIDFGLSRLAPLEIKGGTASYMSPEQIAHTFPERMIGKKFPRPDERSDLYSLGVVWYFCLTGINPFLVAGNTDATLEKHLTLPPPPPSKHRSDIPKHLDKILLQLLQPDPNDRFTTATEVLEQLSLLSGDAYSITPTELRQYYFQQGDWIGQKQVWIPLKQKWEECLHSETPAPSIFYIHGERGQGKTKILDYFKDYAQAHQGRVLFLKQPRAEALEEWWAEIEQYTEDFSQPLVVAIDDFSSDHPAKRKLESLWQKINYARQWDKESKIRWLFILTGVKMPMEKERCGLPTQMLYLKNFETAELGEILTGCPESFLKKLKDHTDGNPQFVFSVLRSLGEQGLLIDDKGRWHPNLYEDLKIDFGDLNIPRDLKESLSENISRLNPEEKKIVEWLACFGGACPKQDLMALAPEVSPFAIETLCSKGLLTADQRGRFNIKNSFLERTIEEALTKAFKQKCHQKIAEYLKKQKRPLHQIAIHLAESSDSKTRREALETLIQFYEETGKFEEALAARKKLFPLLKTEAQKCECVLYMIRDSEPLLRSENALSLANQWIARLSQKKALKGYRASLLREKGMILLNQNKIPEARTHFEKAFAILKNEKKHLKEKLILQNTIARTYLLDRQPDQAIAIYKRTREEAKKLPPAEAKQILNNQLGQAYFQKHDSKNALPCLAEELALYQEAKDKPRLLKTHFNLGSVYRLLMKDYSSAIRHYHLASVLARNLKDPDWLMRIYNGLAGTYLDRAQGKNQKNDYTQALKYFEESLALCLRLKKNASDLDFDRSAILLNIGTVHRELGHFAKAKDIFTTVADIFKLKPSTQPRTMIRLIETYIVLADCLAGQKKYLEMEEVLKKARKLASNHPHLKDLHVVIQILWAELCHRKGLQKSFQKHFNLAQKIRIKHYVHLTPFAKKRWIRLRKFYHASPLFSENNKITKKTL